MPPRISVVIPAHNEEHLIGRTLRTLLEGAGPDELRVVVAANGCTDRTADRAREVPGVTVVEVEKGSKIAALNAGDAAAGDVFPRAYVDADVVMSRDALLALADALDTDEPRAAAPSMRVDSSRSSWPVRQYYKVWQLTDYRKRGHIGSGVYAVSAAGRRRWDEFPDVIADDRFAQRNFAYDERISVDDHEFTVDAPRTLRAVIKRGTRILVGNKQLLTLDLPEGTRGPGGHEYRDMAKRFSTQPRMWVPFAIYYGTFRLMNRRAQKVLAAGGSVGWNQDRTTRTGG
ncbi:glycosyltransferase [Naasia sp. SYSU D00057]|uniref:glycosyltransferase n=1 Tax=Naasia sp. SYSU D00057 TaxID=2817380 RepID=UPI001B3021F9|nr:glycosyltransferase family 2 protein [Naasia sp. SYSU D00057]